MSLTMTSEATQQYNTTANLVSNNMQKLSSGYKVGGDSSQSLSDSTDREGLELAAQSTRGSANAVGIDDVSTLREELDSFQSTTMLASGNSLQVSMENISKVECAIRDANMAYETTAYTKDEIVNNAGTAKVAQANTASQNVLQLLG